MEPLRQGVIDLRAVTQQSPEHAEYAEGVERAPASLVEFLLRYKLFFVAVLVLLCAVFAIDYILEDALESNRDFEITEIQSEEEVGQ
jgi:hypothetical protein